MTPGTAYWVVRGVYRARLLVLMLVLVLLGTAANNRTKISPFGDANSFPKSLQGLCRPLVLHFTVVQYPHVQVDFL